MPKPIWIILCSALISLSACSARATPSPAPPTATLIPTLAAATPTVEVVTVVDRELLGAPHVAAACDAPPEATFTCADATAANATAANATAANATTDVTGTPQLTVQISAATFARWRVQWENAAPLTGNETLTLRLTHQGNLTPNLYLVSAGGTRLGVPLSQFGLTEQAEQAVTQTLHIPLREVRDQEGNTLDLTTVNAIELVFEWADMQGTLTVESLRIDRVWREEVSRGEEARALAAALEVPAGFQVTPVAEDLPQITQIDFTADGDMLASLVNGRVWRYRDTNADGAYDERVLYCAGMLDLVGLLYDPADGGVWLGSRGQLLHTLDEDGDGVADTRTVRFAGLAWGRHQNNGMAWNPDPDPFSGEPGGSWIYFGYGSVDDLEVGEAYNAKILRFPRDGQTAADLQVVSMGNRNAYDVVWAALPTDLSAPDGPRTWQLFASENGPDFNDAPDEVNHIRWGHDYGFPDQFGPVSDPAQEGDPYSSPVYAVSAHASADGIAYIDHPDWPAEYRTLYLSLFGEVFSPVPVGHIVERVTLHTVTTPAGETTYRGEPSTFITGLDRPLPLVTAPDGNLWVGDYATGVVYAIAYTGEPAGG